MANLSSDKIESKLLSFFFERPYHIKLARSGDKLFARTTNRRLAELATDYIRKYKQPPTKETLILFANDIATSTDSIDEFADALLLVDDLPPPKPEEFEFFHKKAVEYQVGREIFDLSESVKTEFESVEEVDFLNLRQEMVNRLLSMVVDSGNRNRGFVYSTAVDRWEAYKTRSQGEQDEGIIPFGINSIDGKVGGMRKSFVTLIYSKSGGGKTRTGINVAINNALAGYNVVYFSLEMAFDLLASCVDSRLGWVDSNEILFGKLDTSDKKKFKKSLKQQMKEKLNIWIVDIPMAAKSIDLMDELELYKAATGLEPDLVVADYANLMEPMVKYNGRSEKYDFLFKELHEIARMQNVALLTMTQEKRIEGSNDKKTTKEDEGGVDNIGLSHYMAPHCEMVIRLKSSKYDVLQNRMWAVFDKNRYGRAGEMFPLVAMFDKNYVGDRLVPGSKRRIRKEPK